ncbi:MAG: carbonic anhydrase/acetyltransferase-like protein (isoleucine patch superfamily) [Rickettsiales bacterium]|jgi:carbonic anhydrase/acetyltransferase-like protein (isoleucine patch superfamily)
MKNILTYRGIIPKIESSAWVAPNAIVSGDVVIGKNVGIWFGCSIRGDVSKIRIGDDTNIQDNSVIHVTRANHVQNKTGDAGGPTIIGKGVTIGHGAIIHACTIEDYSFVGMGSIVMDLARIEKYGMLAAGAVLTPGKIIKSGQIWAGNPARYFRDLTQKERDYIETSATNYVELMMEYKTS